jgi:hypothetical protein
MHSRWILFMKKIYGGVDIRRSDVMRKFLLFGTFAAAAIIAGGIFAHAQPYGPGMMGGYGPGSYGQGNGPGWMMGPGYGHGWMMGGGYGPGMMGYGYGSAERGDGRGPGYRGEQLCWKETDNARGFGYYAPCQK